MKINLGVIMLLFILLASSNISYAMQGDYSMPTSMKTKYNTYYAAEKAAQQGKDINASGIGYMGSKLTEFIYNPRVDMPFEHQEYLFNMTKKRGLDYLKTLALLKHESQYDRNVIAVNDYGYMQINLQNHFWLSNTLLTPNNPLDPYVNINWGTYMLSDFYKHWMTKGIGHSQTSSSIFTKLDRYAMSSYNKGVSGFINNGEAIGYLNMVEKEYRHILDIYKNNLN